MNLDLSSSPISSRERFLEAIVQSAIDYAIISSDLDGVVTSWNEGARLILGWTADEMIGNPANAFFTPEDRENAVPEKEMAAALKDGQGADERWHIKKDETRFWASGQMMLLRGGGNEVVGFIKILRDRTEQREQADRQKLLMHELSHRLKNTLSVVQAIATQSLRNASTLEEAGRTLHARVAAYSRAHEVLLQNDWVSATLRNIIDGAVTNIGLAGTSRVRAEGPDVVLGPQVALAFALVLHELMTNAAKYGALSNSEGIVQITWDLQLARDDEALHIHWEEIGGPLVNAPERKGFGSRLIATSLQSYGPATIDYKPSGVVLDCTMPLSKIRFQNDLTETP